MATLTGTKPKDTYKDLLQISNSNAGVDATLRAVEDGEGTASALSLSTTLASIIDTASLVVGHTASIAISGDASTFEVVGTAGVDTTMALGRWSADATGPEIRLAKSRHTTVGSFTTVQDNDICGIVRFVGDDGTDLANSAATITGLVNGTVAANQVPGELLFQVADDAGALKSALQLRAGASEAAMAVSHAHATTPFGLDLTFSVGSPDDNAQWFIKAQDATTNRFIVYSDGDCQNHDNAYGAISARETKQDEVLSGSQWDDIKAIGGIVKKYRQKDDVAKRGAAARLHLGLVAEDLELVSPGLVRDYPVFADGSNEIVGTQKGVVYSLLYMKAVKALGEALVRIEALERA